MKTIIAGSRTVGEQINLIIDAIGKSGWGTAISEVVSGAAKGADRMGEVWADQNDISVKRFLADWPKYGKAAGPIRNERMAEYADALIAVWDGDSAGTRDMVNRARTRGLKVYVYTFSADE